MAVKGDILTYVEEGTIYSYYNPKLILESVLFNAYTDDARMTFLIIAGTSGDGSGTFSLMTTKTDLDAETASGATTSAKMMNVCDKVLKAYLEGIADNSGVTFTIT